MEAANLGAPITNMGAATNLSASSESSMDNAPTHTAATPDQEKLCRKKHHQKPDTPRKVKAAGNRAAQRHASFDDGMGRVTSTSSFDDGMGRVTSMSFAA